MNEFAFGAPDGGIIQTAFITGDIRRDMRVMTQTLGIGPWYLFEHFPLEDLHYRGVRHELDITLALGNRGGMQYELIEQLDDRPSVYREVLQARGWGFHHYGIGVRDFDAACDRFRAGGHEMALYGVAGVGARAAYFDTLSSAFGMVEVIEVTEPVEALWSLVQEAARDWDGSEPVRRLA